ncbi:MAG: EamA family transporter [Acidimicrobiales bacterium]
MWVLISLAAGTLQTARNGLARSLSGVLPASLLSWSRFAFNLPFSLTLLAIVYLVGPHGPPTLSLRFFVLGLIGGIGQILGNVALINAFKLGTFAQAIVVHKTEVALAAVTGFLFFSEVPPVLGWIGILISAVGVAMIGYASARAKQLDRRVASDDRPAEGLLVANKGTGLALASAGLLVVAGFGIQRATLELANRNPTIDGRFGLAATTLFHVTWMEVVVLTVWLAARERAALAEVPNHLPRLAAIGFTSFGGSLGWFWAFSLSLVAYVKAVGQIESVLSVLLAIYLWKEQRTRDQLPGIALTIVGIFLIVLS